MLSLFSRSSRSRSLPAEPASPEPHPNEISIMESMFSANFSQLQLESTPLPPLQEAPSRPRLRRSRTRRHLQPSPRHAGREPLGMPGPQPFRMLFFGVHGGRIFSGRMRRGAAEVDITYESMLALDENNARRAVKAQVLDGLHRSSAAEGCEDCQICMESWLTGPGRIHLPCSHAFCEPCTRSWLGANSSCPICRWQFKDEDTYLMHGPH